MPLDDSDKKFITDLLAAANAETLKVIDERVNGAVTSKLKAHTEKQTDASKPVLERIEALTKELEALKSEPTPPKKKAAGDAPDADEPEVVKSMRGEVEALKKRISASEKAREEAAKAAEAERVERMRREEMDVIGLQLEKGNVLPHLRPMLARELREVRKTIVRSKENPSEILYREVDPKTNEEAFFSVEAGIAKFLETEEGKQFVAPRKVGGSGLRPAGGGAGNNATPTNREIGEALATSIFGGG